MIDLRDVVARILSAEGAAVEFADPAALTVLAPPRLCRALDLPELSQLAFGPAPPPGAHPFRLESDWIERLEGLLGARGSTLDLALPDLRGNAAFDAAAMAAKHLVLNNATFRVAPAERAWTRCVAVSFRVRAVSDEKREDLLTVCLNESNGACVDDLPPAWQAHLRTLGDAKATAPTEDQLPAPWSRQQLADWCLRALKARWRLRFAPFLDGMRRRMTTDIDRLHDYYSRMLVETLHPTRRGRSHKNDAETIAVRERAIRRDYAAKLADLRHKYAVSVEVAIEQVARLAVPVQRIPLTILRRKGRRAFHLDRNRFSGHVDRVPCEACGDIPSVLSACDDHIHLLCPACSAPCPKCGKPLCLACHPEGCPRCSTAGERR